MRLALPLALPLLIISGFLASLPAAGSSLAKKPELAAEPDIALLFAAGKTAKPTEPLPGLAYRLIELGDYGVKIHVWSFDERRYRLRLVEQNRPQGARVDGLLGPKDVFGINGGFFERDKQKLLAPSGLLILEGKEVAPEHERAGSGIVYANAGGVFIGYRKDLTDHAAMEYALQVGPVLVDPGGKVGVANKQHDRQNRSAICLAADRFVIVAVEGGLSLFQLASVLAAPARDGGLGCDVALNLDGGPSTQALFRANGRQIAIEGGSPVANALIVSPSSTAP